MYEAIFQKIKECIQLTNIKHAVFIAIDGPHKAEVKNGLAKSYHRSSLSQRSHSCGRSKRIPENISV